SAASLGVHRFRFFGREAISFLLVLPIALPGIVTGMALNSYFTFWKFNFGLWTIVIGHATFCVVVVYNNVIARLLRVPVPRPVDCRGHRPGARRHGGGCRRRGRDGEACAARLARLDARRARRGPAQARRPARRECGGARAARVAQRRQAALLRARRDAGLL